MKLKVEIYMDQGGYKHIEHVEFTDVDLNNWVMEQLEGRMPEPELLSVIVEGYEP